MKKIVPLNSSAHHLRHGNCHWKKPLLTLKLLCLQVAPCINRFCREYDIQAASTHAYGKWSPASPFHHCISTEGCSESHAPNNGGISILITCTNLLIYSASFDLVICHTGNPATCPAAHPGERARRRDIRLHAYAPVACSLAKRVNSLRIEQLMLRRVCLLSCCQCITLKCTVHCSCSTCTALLKQLLSSLRCISIDDL